MKKLISGVLIASLAMTVVLPVTEAIEPVPESTVKLQVKDMAEIQGAGWLKALACVGSVTGFLGGVYIAIVTSGTEGGTTMGIGMAGMTLFCND